MPVYYDTVFVGPGKDHILKFKDPLTPNSVLVDKEEPRGGVIAKIEHPVGMDYSQVRIWTTAQGTARVTGVSEQTRHIQPVVVDPRAGMRAVPPLALKVTRGLTGITVTFQPNPENKEKVVVQAYEVFRKRARDMDGEFQRVSQLPVLDSELTDQARQLLRGVQAERGAAAAGGAGVPYAPGQQGAPHGVSGTPGWRGQRLGPRLPPAEAPGPAPPVPTRVAPAEEVKEVVYTWMDAGKLLLGETYLYKVRTVAYLSYPKESEFTQAQAVTTLPARDFRFTGLVGGKVRFEVAVFEGGHIRRKEFRNAVGDEIGGLDYNQATAQLENFLTGCYLVDYHRSVRLKEKTGFRDRIIFVNQRGEPEARWREETVAPELFGAETAGPVAPVGGVIPVSPPSTPPGGGGEFVRPYRWRP